MTTDRYCILGCDNQQLGSFICTHCVWLHSKKPGVTLYINTVYLIIISVALTVQKANKALPAATSVPTPSASVRDSVQQPMASSSLANPLAQQVETLQEKLNLLEKQKDKDFLLNGELTAKVESLQRGNADLQKWVAPFSSFLFFPVDLLFEFWVVRFF